MKSILKLLGRLGLAASVVLTAVSAYADTPKPPVLIGLDAEFGHPTSTSDDAIKMGMLTAIDEINAKGGVLGGRPLKLVETDSRSVPSRGVENYRSLAAMPDLVGMFVGKFSPVAIEQARIAGELKTPLLDPWAAADEIISEPANGTYAFRLSLRDAWAVPVMLDHLVDQQNVVWSEVTDVDRRCSYARVERLPLDVDDLHAAGLKTVLKLLLEVAKLIDVSGAFASVEFADQPTKQAREAPAFDGHVDQ